MSVILISVAGVVGTIVASKGVAEDKTALRAKSIQNTCLSEIKKKAPKLYMILEKNTRNLSEFEEQYLLKDILQYDKDDSPFKKAIFEFKKDYLDKRTDNPCFIKPPESYIPRAKVNPSEEYGRVQNELHEIKKAVIGAKMNYANEELSLSHKLFDEKTHDSKLGIDVIDESRELKREKYFNRLAKEYDERPLSNISPKEAKLINSTLAERKKSGKISEKIADNYMQKVEKAAGIEPIIEPSKEYLERKSDIKHSQLKDAQRQAEKAIEQESYFRGPTEGRHIAEGESRFGNFFRKLKEKISPEFKYRQAAEK